MMTNKVIRKYKRAAKDGAINHHTLLQVGISMVQWLLSLIIGMFAFIRGGLPPCPCTL